MLLLGVLAGFWGMYLSFELILCKRYAPAAVCVLAAYMISLNMLSYAFGIGLSGTALSQLISIVACVCGFLFRWGQYPLQRDLRRQAVFQTVRAMDEEGRQTSDTEIARQFELFRSEIASWDHGKPDPITWWTVAQFLIRGPADLPPLEAEDRLREARIQWYSWFDLKHRGIHTPNLS